MQRNGATQDQVTAKTDQYRTALLNAAIQIGYTRDDAQRYVDTVLRTPSDRATTFHNNALAAKADIDAYAGSLHATQGTYVATVIANLNPAQQAINQFLINNSAIRIALQAGADIGNLVARAEGGINLAVPMAAGGMRTMDPGIADVIPPNTPTLVGDNKRFNESYIPWDPGSHRAQQVFDMTAVALHRTVVPMADGGLVGQPPLAQQQPVPALVRAEQVDAARQLTQAATEAAKQMRAFTDATRVSADTQTRTVNIVSRDQQQATAAETTVTDIATRAAHQTGLLDQVGRAAVDSQTRFRDEITTSATRVDVFGVALRSLAELLPHALPVQHPAAAAVPPAAPPAPVPAPAAPAGVAPPVGDAADRATQQLDLFTTSLHNITVQQQRTVTDIASTTLTQLHALSRVPPLQRLQADASTTPRRTIPDTGPLVAAVGQRGPLTAAPGAGPGQRAVNIATATVERLVVIQQQPGATASGGDHPGQQLSQQAVQGISAAVQDGVGKVMNSALSNARLRLEDDGRGGVARIVNRQNRALSRA